MTPVQNIAQQEYKLIRAVVWTLQLFIYWEMTAEETSWVSVVILEPFFFHDVCRILARQARKKVWKPPLRALGRRRIVKLQWPCCRFSTIECKMLKRIQEVEWKHLVGPVVCTQSIKWSAVTPILLDCSPVDMLLIRCICYLFLTAVFLLLWLLPAVCHFTCFLLIIKAVHIKPAGVWTHLKVDNSHDLCHGDPSCGNFLKAT